MHEMKCKWNEMKWNEMQMQMQMQMQMPRIFIGTLKVKFRFVLLRSAFVFLILKSSGNLSTDLPFKKKMITTVQYQEPAMFKL